jgi:hypothetical protein
MATPAVTTASGGVLAAFVAGIVVLPPLPLPLWWGWWCFLLPLSLVVVVVVVVLPPPATIVAHC